MKEMIKHLVRETLITFRIDLTKNLEYDRYTRTIINKYVKPNYNCIDIGCHKGEILDLLLKNAPKGKHFAFEPIPQLFKALTKKYNQKARLFPFALSDKNEKTKFQLVKNALAYSGIKRRRYDIENPVIEEINIETKTLDTIISPNENIHFIKIDVEGGEFGVLKGAINILQKNRPMIIFECGKGASDFYGTDPLDLYNFITEEVGLKIYTLQAFVKKQPYLDQVDFVENYNTNKEYYFIANDN